MKRDNWVGAVFTVCCLFSFGCSDLFAPKSEHHALWHVTGRGFCSPALDDSVVFFPSDDHHVLALDAATGAARWNTALGRSEPTAVCQNAVTASGMVVAADVDLYGLKEATGQIAWQFHPASGARPGYFNIATDGAAVFTGSPDGWAFAVDATTGAQLWATHVATDATPTNVMDPTTDGADVFLTYRRFTSPVTGGVVAIDRLSGAIKWRREFTSARPTAGAGAGGKVAFWKGATLDLVMVAVDDGRIWGLDRSTGAIDWICPLPPAQGAGLLRPLVMAGETLVAGSNEETLMGYDPATGIPRWTLPFNRSSSLTTFVSREETVYFNDSGLELVALDAMKGAILWRLVRDRGFTSYPAVGADKLYVPGFSGFYAVGK